MRLLWRTLRHTARLAGSHRKLWIPFLLTAVVELSLLGLVALAPHPPFSRLLAPPIRYVAGERVLHYPWHLWFLYHVVPQAHLIASIVTGAVMTGVACAMVRQIHDRAPLSFRAALISQWGRIKTLLIVWVVVWGLAQGVRAACRAALRPPAGWPVWAAIGMELWLQAVFSYAIPAAVFEAASWWSAVLHGVREFLRQPATTFGIVAIALAPGIAFALLAPDASVARWMAQVTPEIALPLLVIRVLIWTTADAVLTTAVAHLWWLRRAPHPGAEVSGVRAPTPRVAAI